MTCDLAMCAENFVDILPNTVEELKKRSVWPEWEAAVVSEMDALTSNQAWTVSELPPGRKVIDSRWVFKLKHGVEGSRRHKASKEMARKSTSLCRMGLIRRDL